ncbi:hypothetical protein INS49_004042 [Diaporthe citri]|uniref:uncharacterized protein n=1 Tax=Diaporthe citri TaxID=83186 RepID=UPI001C802B92|nr:uncharacterized protein INS49_004042 [Diaporthe citri]KAG6354961.1 hypothetical protein INS49_004042 [Diaporthe citri]
MKNKFREVLPFRRKQATATDPGPYEPIDSSKEEIRIIHLLPGDFDDTINLELATVSLASNPKPQYDALSYVWGQEQCQTPAFVNGRPVTVTSNLDIALRYFRHQHDEKTLWVDAVCINQKDNMEKGPQVQMMGQIYSKAAQVLVWLGPAADGSDELLERMSQGLTEEEIADPTLQNASLALMGQPWFTRIWVQQEIALAARDPTMRCGRHALSWADWCLYTLRFLFALEDAFREVMHRQAMEGVAIQPLESDNEEVAEEKHQKLLKHIENNKRAMAIQKALLTLENLASLRARVEMASGTYNDKMFEITAYVKAQKDPQAIASVSGTNKPPLSADELKKLFKEMGMGEEAMRDYIKSYVGRDDPTEFAQLLGTVSHLDATDDRDKVFGILGLAKFLGEPIKADYDKNKRQVYSEAMATIIRDSLDLSYTRLSIVDSKKKGLPSWVPEIGGKTLRGADILPTYRAVETAMRSARANITPATFSNDYQTLTVGGAELGRVSVVIETPVMEDPELTDPDERFTLKDELKSLIDEKGIPLRTVWETLIGSRVMNLLTERDATWDDGQMELLRSDAKLHQAVTIMCGQEHRDPQGLQDRLSQADLRFLRLQFYETCRKATLFFTDTGKLGLVIGRVAKGDIVAALFGVGMTFVLRRASSLSTFMKELGKKERTQEPTYEMIGTCHVGGHKLGHVYEEYGFHNFVIN